jgi:hypothetical protein
VPCGHARDHSWDGPLPSSLQPSHRPCPRAQAGVIRFASTISMRPPGRLHRHRGRPALASRRPALAGCWWTRGWPPWRAGTSPAASGSPSSSRGARLALREDAVRSACSCHPALVWCPPPGCAALSRWPGGLSVTAVPPMFGDGLLAARRRRVRQHRRSGERPQGHRHYASDVLTRDRPDSPQRRSRASISTTPRDVTRNARTLCRLERATDDG